MKREGESDAGKLAAVIAAASAGALSQEAAQAAIESRTSEEFRRRVESERLGPEATRAVRAARQRRLAAHAEEHADPRAIVAPRRAPTAPVPRSSERKKKFLAAMFATGRVLSLNDFDGKTIQIARHAASSPVGVMRCLAMLPRELARRVRRAALLGDGQSEARNWHCITARRTVAYALLVYRSSRRTNRRGFGSCCAGVTVGMLASIIRNPQTQRAYSRGALVGRVRDGADPAPLAALSQCGAWYREQPPAAVMPAHLVGKDRDGTPRAVGLFWFSEACVSESLDDAPAPDAGSPATAPASADEREPRPPDREP